MKSKWISLLGLGLVAGQVLGAEPTAQKPLRFIFITTCVEEAFFKPVEQGMKDAAARMNVECKFTGTRGVDIPAQVEMVRQAVRDGYDGIALNIIDPVAFDAVVAETIQKGVPVVAFNVDDYASPNARLSAVCQRYYDAGKITGAECAKYIPNGSHVLMTMHASGVSALDDRLRGEQEELKKKGVTWTVAVTGNSSAEAHAVIRKELIAHPDIHYVVCTGQADTEGAGLAIEEDFKGKGIVAAGFDLGPEILRLLKAGHIRFTIDQQPYIQGFYPVVQLTLLKRYGIRPSSMDAGASIVTKEQADSVMELCKGNYR
jgi:simple sugar transport system substrate-binding protein